MQGKTHRIGGALSALLGFTILESNGMLLPNVNPFIQLTIIYPFALYGSIMSDLDHGDQSIPAKDPISVGINKVLHLTSGIRKKSGKSIPILNIFDAKHRSWQTHSALFLFLFIGLWVWLLSSGGFVPNAAITMDAVSLSIIKLVLTGLLLGLISHLLLDAITPEGIWFLIPTIIRRKKVSFRLVPKTKFFATGGPWERLIGLLMWVVIIILTIYTIYLATPYRISFNG